jgi:hypothetical protein
MRSDEIQKTSVVLMMVAYMVSKGEKVTAGQVYKHLPNHVYASLPRLQNAINYLTSIGAIVWEYRAHGRKAGKVKCVRPEKFIMRYEISRSAVERELKFSKNLWRWQSGERVIDGECYLTSDVIEGLKAAFPDKQLDFDKLFKLIDGHSLKQVLNS